MPSVIVAGAGLAGMAAAAALADAGFDVDVFESRPYSGGRATSYPIPHGDGTTELLDNCQHILLRCCVNLLDFYRRLGVSGLIEFHREFYWLEPGGRMSVFRAGHLPAPAHFTEAFLGLHFLTLREKIAVSRGMLAVARDRRTTAELDAIPMLTWLRQHGQPERVIDLFWRQVLVSAVNEELDRMSTYHGLQVFRLGFLANGTAYEMGVPVNSLSDLYAALQRPNLRIHFRSGVTSFEGMQADYYVAAVPVEQVKSIVPGFDPPPLEHSPITGVHLFFDRSVTDLPHATLLERDIQWMFNKGAGRQLHLVISASRSFTRMPRADVIDTCVRQLQEYFPAVREAKLLKAHVVKEVRATISAQPGVAQTRPGVQTAMPNVFVAGDWTWTGWPSTMEGAVRSGYAAADAICAAVGVNSRFLLPDIA